MRWTGKARRKAALIINGHAREVASRAPRDRGLYDFTDARERLVLEHFQSMGIHAASDAEWKVDPRPNHPPLFKPDKENLYIWICTDHILKVPKSAAEKILVLGLP